MGLRHEAVEDSPDWYRIRELPTSLEEIPESVSQRLEDALRAPGGTMRMRPVQIQALHDIGTVGGLLGPIRVGGGKTLVSMLAAHVLEARRPLLLIPAGLIQKTERDQRALAKHWLIPRHIRMMSYESLGRVQAAQDLELYRPDLIVADEAHRLKNPRAACTRRVSRYMEEHPDTKFVAMSGTLIKHSLRDFGKLAAWSLKKGAPVPLEWRELETWADALDEKINPLKRVKPGVLGPNITAAREWFHNRLVGTPGVVATSGSDVEASLYVRALEHPVNTATEENFERLRQTWTLPCGWALSTAVDVWRHARELALGLHYVWDPRPPREWLDARAAWAKFARDTIKNSTHSNNPLDSELQVVNAVDRGDIDDDETLAQWRRIKPTFTIHSKPVWHDDSALRAAEDWCSRIPPGHGGIIWTEHTFFAEACARRLGCRYFGPGGMDREGNPIERESGTRSVVASVAANSTGRNLQSFGSNLVCTGPTGADQWEQLIGRTHRDGQVRDTVTVDVFYTCAEHHVAMEKARQDARMHEQIMGQPQKLLMADFTWPDRITETSDRWCRTTT